MKRLSAADRPKDPASPKTGQKSTKSQKPSTKIITALLFFIFLAAAGALGFVFYQSQQSPTDDPKNPTQPDTKEPLYNTLTGLEIPDASQNSAPTFCVQIPNGYTDGARPQAGLSAAAVVFEAIAETGITRFAAVFQNPEVGVIGPIRSLRPYYLDWDTPFDCTVVHSGGSDEALAAISWGGQRDLDESYAYMWRESSPSRFWNNLFTSPSLVAEFNSSRGYNSSAPKAFARQTPNASQERAFLNNSCLTAGVTEDGSAPAGCDATPTQKITISLGDDRRTDGIYNSYYIYNSEKNTYTRFYADGTPHTSYLCPQSLDQGNSLLNSPPNTQLACGDPVQLTPSVVITLHVRQNTMSDNYHENIETIGSGPAEIFQNGEVISATWQKSSQKDQLKFLDASGEVIPLAPGQTWIVAVPQYGSVDY